jgi:hypothetical protein
MKLATLEQMTGGWFVGNFEPSILKTNDVEVAVKKYKSGEKEEWHVHKIATEITVLVTGRVRMNEQFFNAGDIITLEPGEGSDFEVLEDAVTVVVKLPGANDDKYLSGE